MPLIYSSGHDAQARNYPDRVTEQPGPRFLTIPQVAEELATSQAQIMALLKRGDLPTMQIGGRG